MLPVIDVHCHVFPDKIAAKATEGIGAFYGAAMPLDGTLATLERENATSGITLSVIHSVATTPHQVSAINRFIADTVQAGGGRYVGFGSLHPDAEDLQGDVENILALGLRGVKLHPDIQGFKLDDYRCLKIFELCEGRLPVLLHLGDSRYDLSNPNRVRPILETYTNLTVIGAHFGGWSMWEQATEALHGIPNFYVDCSSSFFAMDNATAVRLIREYGADRVLFGTDYPMWHPGAELKRFLSLDLTEEERRDILYRNAEKLLGIRAEGSVS